MQLIGLGCAFFSVSTVEAPYYCFLHKSCSYNRGYDKNPVDGLPDGLGVLDSTHRGEGESFSPSRQNAGPTGFGDSFFSRRLNQIGDTWQRGLLPRGG
jgi:hypothetical protein